MKNLLLTFAVVDIVYTIIIFFVLFTQYKILIHNSLLAPRNNLRFTANTIGLLVVGEFKRVPLLLPIILIQQLYWIPSDVFALLVLRAAAYGISITLLTTHVMKYNGKFVVEAIQNVGVCILLLAGLTFNVITTITDWQGWIMLTVWCLAFSCFFTCSRVTLAFIMSRNNWYRSSKTTIR